MPIRTNIDVFISRMANKISTIDLSDPDTAERLTRIALLLENRTKLNVRQQQLVDTGNLLNSIKGIVLSSEVGSATIRYGSFGVGYAAYHEYGFHGNVNIPAHARTRGGNAHDVRAHTRNVNYNGRPYIRPALAMMRRRILQVLKGEA